MSDEPEPGQGPGLVEGVLSNIFRNATVPSFENHEHALLEALHSLAPLPSPDGVSISSGLLWRHPCFVDALATEFVSPSRLKEQAEPLERMRRATGDKSSCGLALPLSFVHDLLHSTYSSLPSSLHSQAQSVMYALKQGARLSKMLPMTGARKLLPFLKELLALLRALPVGGVLVVPAGWAVGGLACTLLLVLRREDKGQWAMAVCTASDGAAYHPAYLAPLRVTPSFDPCLLLRGIPDERLLDSSAWVVLFRGLQLDRRGGASTAEHTGRTLYEVVLPFLHQRPLPASLAASPPPRLWRRPRAPGGDASRTAAAFEAVGALVVLGGGSAAAARQLCMLVRAALLRGVRLQLATLRSAASAAASISAAEHETLEAACKGLARDASAQAAVAEEEGAASAATLLGVARLVKETRDAAEALRARRAGFVPPRASLPAAKECHGAAQLPLFGRMRREADVEAQGGMPPPPPFLRPVALSTVTVPPRVTSAHEACVAMQRAALECTLLATQAEQVRNSAALRLALLRSLLCTVVPLPLPLDSPHRATLCFWQQGAISHETQAQLLRLLPTLAGHLLVSSLALQVTREMDACRLLLLGALVAIADGLLRASAADTPSTFCEHYSGRAFPRAGGGTKGGGAAFGFDTSRFALETDTLKFVTPELVVMRGQLLDYFGSVARAAPEERRVFGWERGGTEFGGGELLLAEQLCCAVGHPRQRELLPRYLSGEASDLVSSCPELVCLRDLLFLFKLFLSPSAQALPEPRPQCGTHERPWACADATLTWQHAREKSNRLEVRGFGRVLLVQVGRHVENQFEKLFKEIFGVSLSEMHATMGGRPKLRAPPSGADPARLFGVGGGDKGDLFGGLGGGADRTKSGEGGASAMDEDGVLGLSSSQLAELRPLSGRDAELLLSYLTAPYLRIPLLLNFFADVQRISALASPRIQSLLEAALFEPGPWQPSATRPLPTHIPPRPSERAAQLGTPQGLLFNELVNAPGSLLTSLNAMVGTALDMETGSFEGASAAVIFFLVRIATRVEAYALFVQQHNEWRRAHPLLASSGKAAAAATLSPYAVPSGALPAMRGRSRSIEVMTPSSADLRANGSARGAPPPLLALSPGLCTPLLHAASLRSPSRVSHHTRAKQQQRAELQRRKRRWLR